MTLETQHLSLRGIDRTRSARYLCIALAHDERHMLASFLDHYRAFGDVTFVIVDDRSTDGTAEFLAAQEDVTVMEPKSGSTFAEHKREWRGQVLDRVASDRWIIAPDLDERLVWSGYPKRTFDMLLERIVAEGAQALFAIMLDMYADKPISEQILSGDDPAPVFPLFDDPRLDPASVWMRRAPGRFLRNWPTPEMTVVGGMRQRLIEEVNGGAGPLTRAARRSFGGLRDHRGSGNALVRRLTDGTGRTKPLNMTKIPVVRWQSGMRFYSGAHALNRPLNLASERAAMLHYPVTQGLEGIRRIVSRGQHAGNSVYYRRMEEVVRTNPRYAGTARFDTVADIEGIVTAPDGGA